MRARRRLAGELVWSGANIFIDWIDVHETVIDAIVVYVREYNSEKTKKALDH